MLNKVKIMNISNIVKFLEYWKEGKFTFDFSSNNIIRIEGTKEKIVIDILDKELIKSFINLDSMKASDDMNLEEIAKKLDDIGITLVLAIEGKDWLVLGKDAKAGILKLFGKEDIQIKNITDIIKSILQIKL